MVALNTAYAPRKTSTRSENRVGDFFCEAGERVGNNRLASRIGTKGKTTYSCETASGLPVWPSELGTGGTAELRNWKRSQTFKMNFSILIRRSDPRCKRPNSSRILAQVLTELCVG